MDVRSSLISSHAHELALRQERLVARVSPLGFDTVVMSKVGGARVTAQFRATQCPWKRIVMCLWFDYRNDLDREEWCCGNPITKWEGPVCDTPDAAYVAAELADWGRANEERDYSKSSEV